jgi:hypothetical protein
VAAACGLWEVVCGPAVASGPWGVTVGSEVARGLCSVAEGETIGVRLPGLAWGVGVARDPLREGCSVAVSRGRVACGWASPCFKNGCAHSLERIHHSSHVIGLTRV